MAETVYLLWYVRERENAEDIELLIGVYTTEATARAAVDRLKNKRGFTDFPQGFQIHASKLDRDSWTDGFVELE